MRRSSTRTTLVLGGALALALSAVPLHAAAKYDYDPSASFAEYRSFKLMGERPQGPAARVPRPRRERTDASPLREKQIEQAIQDELEQKGLELVESGPADLLVAYSTGTQRDAVGYGWGPRYRGQRRVVVYEEGVLTIDLVDRESRELVWRGSIAATMKENPEKLHQQIGNLVEKILTNYPPPAK